MPVVSKAQNRWAHATEEGKTDAPPSVGREFVNASKGESIGKLPQHVNPKKHAFMAKRAAAHGSQRKAAGEFGQSKSSFNRHLTKGFKPMGKA